MDSTKLDYSWIIYSLYPIVLASLFSDRAVSNIFAVCTDNHSPQAGAFTTRCAHLSLLGWLIFILIRAALRLHFIFNGQCILNWWDRAHFSHIPRKIHRKQSMRSVWSTQGQCTIRATLWCYPIARAQCVTSLLSLDYPAPSGHLIPAQTSTARPPQSKDPSACAPVAMDETDESSIYFSLSLW